jgi:acyl-CoA thioester hydrolase
VLVRDLDPQAHMANHVYVAYLSEARARWMLARDSDGRLFRPSVVADVHVRYVSSLLARETFRVGVRVTKVGRSSVTFGYRFEGGDGRLVAEGDSVEVLVDAGTRRPRPFGDEARRVLAG